MGDIREIVRLALPLTIGQLGQMGMILIDMVMVGKLGPAAIAGVGLGSSFYYVPALFAAGILFGLDYFVSHASGREDKEACRHWLWQGLYLSMLISAPVVLAIEVLGPLAMRAWFSPDLAAQASAFLVTSSFGMPGFLVFTTVRQYLQASGSPRAGTVVTLLGVGCIVGLNWLFIFGPPQMGVAGAGLATSVTRTLMALALLGFMAWRDGLVIPAPWAGQDVVKLVRLGTPIGVQLALEVGVFSLVSFLIGRFGAVAAAAHTVVANVAGFTYTLPMALSGATAILVGRALGSGDRDRARTVGWKAIGLGTSLMAVMGLGLAAGGSHVAALFTTDAQVIALASQLIVMVALFQVADGIQSVGGGALRGLGDTRASMLANLLGYWAVGVPVGYYFCFQLKWGALGFWVGLTAGLYAVAVIVLRQWIVLARFREDERT
ncbi:MAG: efflux family protein [Cyanobacteria bacterium RYN_339]|nr:efflux family protein [Cyanobacteria bacterium RYN_339]